MKGGKSRSKETSYGRQDEYELNRSEASSATQVDEQSSVSESDSTLDSSLILCFPPTSSTSLSASDEGKAVEFQAVNGGWKVVLVVSGVIVDQIGASQSHAINEAGRRGQVISITDSEICVSLG